MTKLLKSHHQVISDTLFSYTLFYNYTKMQFIEYQFTYVAEKYCLDDDFVFVLAQPYVALCLENGLDFAIQVRQLLRVR